MFMFGGVGGKYQVNVFIYSLYSPKNTVNKAERASAWTQTVTPVKTSEQIKGTVHSKIKIIL